MLSICHSHTCEHIGINLGLTILPMYTGMQTGAARSWTANLTIDKWPAPDPQPESCSSGKSGSKVVIFFFYQFIKARYTIFLLLSPLRESITDSSLFCDIKRKLIWIYTAIWLVVLFAPQPKKRKRAVSLVGGQDVKSSAVHTFRF